MFVNTEKKYIWKNGTFEKWNDTNVHILSHTLHYGTGVFEGVRAYSTENGPAIFKLKDHTKRLFDAASKIGINITFTEDELNKAQCDTLIKNNLKEGYLRPIVFLGNEGLGLRAKDLSVNVAVAAWEWPSYMDPEAKKNGISVIKSSHRQYENPLHSGNKIIGTYFSNTMALHEALDKGADEALMLDKNGYISEGSGENIFIVKDDVIYTPTTEHCLNGITRQSVMQIAEDLQLQIFEKDIDYEYLLNADEAFFTGTAVEITPISKIDNNFINTGKRGKITELLQNKFQQIICGKDYTYESGVMITGSHNPKEYNGIKLVINDKPVSGNEILKLIYVDKPIADKSGNVSYIDIKNDYISEVKDNINFDFKNKIKIVIDCGNGAAGCIAPILYKELGCEVIELYSEVDGSFPNHHPDPGKLENLKALIDSVRATNADLGLAFDGDGDRVGLITDKGGVVFPDKILMMLSYFLQVLS